MPTKRISDPETLRLKAIFIVGNYFVRFPLDALPYRGENNFDINGTKIPAREAFLVLDLWFSNTGHKKHVIFLVLWNANKHIVSLDYPELTEMFYLSERGPVNMEILL